MSDNSGGKGGILAILVIVVILILGLYFLVFHNGGMFQQQQPETPTLEINVGGGNSSPSE